MPDEVTTEKTATETQQGAANVELEAARAELASQKKSFDQRMDAQKATYDLHRNQFQQQITQLQSQQPQQYGEPQEPEGHDVAQLRKQVETLRAQHETDVVDRFRENNPDYWEDVNAIINDEVRAKDVAVWDQQGNVDYGRSLKNAKREVELNRFRALQEKTDDAKKGQKEEQDRQKGMATISGTGVSEVEEEVDVSKMTSDEMIDAGMVDMDPRDPVHKRHPNEG